MMKVIVCFLLVESVLMWCLKTTQAKSSQVVDVEYSPHDGVLYAVTTADGVVHLYSGNNMYQVKSFDGRTATDVRFSGDGLKLVIGYDDSTISIYSTQSPYDVLESWDAAHGGGDMVVDVSDDSSILLTCSSNRAKLWDISGSPSLQYTYTISQMITCKLDRDKFIGAGASNNKLNYYLPDGTAPPHWSINYDECQDIEFESNRLWMVAACNDGGGEGVLIDVASGTVDRVMVTDSSMRAAAYSQDGSIIVFGGDDGLVRIFNATGNNFTQIATFPTDGSILTLTTSNSGNFVLVGTDSGMIYEYAKYCQACSAGYYLSSLGTCEFCSLTIRGCGICTNSTFCSECVQGYYVNSTYGCQSCNIIDGCGACASSSTCVFCLPGFYLDGAVCGLCGDSIQGCFRCVSGTQCELCGDDYYLAANKTCVDCSSLGDCSLCSSSSFCTTCQMGYYNDGAGNCISCSSHCVACLSATQCLECGQGYFSDVGGCSPCGFGCLVCNESDYCLDCQTSMKVQNGSCIVCQHPCDDCNDSQCVSCMLGYRIDTGVCVQCPYLCLVCNTTDCVQCQEGYYLSTGVCASCVGIQAHCSACSDSVCLNCSIGYYISGTSCMSCSSMLGCISCADSVTCLHCGIGFYFNANACEPCVDGCALCDSAVQCSLCVEGYYYDSSACTRCVFPCRICESAAICTECTVGYYVDSADTCILCNETLTNCLECSSEADCINCEVGYYLSLDECVRCIWPCISCDVGVCYTCSIGYFLDGVACSLCPEECVQCVSLSNCSSCVVGYYLQLQTCVSCATKGCVSCNDSECFSCQEGSYLNAGICELCLDAIDDCQYCVDASTCEKCMFGYALGAGNATCESCSQMDGCFACTSLTTCDICELGYYESTGDCEVCEQGCLSCTGVSLCSSCRDGYLLDSSICVLCDSVIKGCELCVDSATCVQCAIPYYLNGGTCSLCRSVMKGCEECSSSSTCIDCQVGYYFVVDECELCADAMQGCEVCDSSSVCVMCGSGYYLSTDTCIKCHVVMQGCQTCVDGTHCDQCQYGYYIDGGCEQCNSVIDGCIECIDENTCIQCEGGYYVSGGGLCVQCGRKGCEICQQDSPNDCLSCNSMYFLNSDRCYYCGDYLSGCLECSGSSVCTTCENGYFINGFQQCQLCQESLEGCSRCDSGSVCEQCKSAYFLDGTICTPCMEEMVGCLYCANSSSCLGCASMYYLTNTSSCQLCTVLPGCIVCESESRCLVCEGRYFLHNDSCHPCELNEGCYSCSNNISCDVCIGGYLLNDDQLCEVMTVQGDSDEKDIKVQTYYVNDSCLYHLLLPHGMLYQQHDYSTAQWQDNVDIILQYPNFTLINLTITSGEWLSTESLKFYTNNPITDMQVMPMPFSRRMLSSLPEGYKIYVEVKQQTINTILPDLYQTSNLVVDNLLVQPTFYLSYLNEHTNFAYGLFGIVLLLVLIINYSIRATVTCKSRPPHTHAQILPHIIAIKSVPLIKYPVYGQMISYCYGFMVMELPWANELLGKALGEQGENIPPQFMLFYSSMNIGGTMLLCLVVGVLLLLVMWLYYRNGLNQGTENVVRSCSLPEWNVKVVFYNCIVVGLIWGGSLSLQGAVLNPTNQLTVNSLFYMIGICCWFIILFDCIVSLYHSPQAFYKFHILLKHTLLSLCHFSPIYLFSCTCAISFLCVVIQFRITMAQLNYPKVWLMNNFMMLVALGMVMGLPEFWVSLIGVSVVLLGVSVSEIVMHVLEKRLEGQPKEKKSVSSSDLITDGNVWDISFSGINTPPSPKCAPKAKQTLPKPTLSKQFKSTEEQKMQEIFIYDS